MKSDNPGMNEVKAGDIGIRGELLGVNPDFSKLGGEEDCTMEEMDGLGKDRDLVRRNDNGGIEDDKKARE
jgi:hypothetical protein